MPLPPSATSREHLHTRQVECRGYRRADGLWDIEGHLLDSKTHPEPAVERGTIAPGEPIHDMWLRLTVDGDLTIRAVATAMDRAPYRICPSTAPNFHRLCGLTIGPGFLCQGQAIARPHRGLHPPGRTRRTGRDDRLPDDPAAALASRHTRIAPRVPNCSTAATPMRATGRSCAGNGRSSIPALPRDQARDSAGGAVYAGGATDRRPTTPWRSISRATSPDFFASSTKSRRKAAPAALLRAVPTACCTAVNWPSRIRAPGNF